MDLKHEHAALLDDQLLNDLATAYRYFVVHTVLLNKREAVITNGSYHSMNGNYYISFDQFKTHGAVVYNSANVTLSERSWDGFDGIKIDNSGRLTLVAQDKENVPVSVEGGNSVIFTNTGQLVLTSGKSGTGDALYTSRELAFDRCDNDQENHPVYGLLYKGKPAFNDTSLKTATLSSPNQESKLITEFLLSHHLYENAIGWIKKEGEREVYVLEMMSDAVTGQDLDGNDAWVTCLFDSPCISGPMINLTTNSLHISREMVQISHQISAYQCADEVQRRNATAILSVTNDGNCFAYFWEKELEERTAEMSHFKLIESSGSTICFLKGRNRCPQTDYSIEAPGVSLIGITFRNFNDYQDFDDCVLYAFADRSRNCNNSVYGYTIDVVNSNKQCRAIRRAWELVVDTGVNDVHLSVNLPIPHCFFEHT
ncbi:uncharacterized protein LOC142340122 isoform X2 [Convolutriloba macropyga]|uniref:uncharacterized protein LOC142340122 isoform X2 n=1 Tax=Convolutriloba macropyga TaxID=536237 RepID=UPI003F527E60